MTRFIEYNIKPRERVFFVEILYVGARMRAGVTAEEDIETWTVCNVRRFVNYGD